MEVTPIIAGRTGPTTQQSEASSALSSDFETFLVMLTAQMENQDPLNPLDSQDFATQLATFSGVEQQVQTNDLLGALSSQMLTSSLGDMASWIGKDARMAIPASFDGAPIELVANPPSFAERTELVVRDANGTEVQRRDIPVGDSSFTWAGTYADGTPFSNGTYSFEVVAYSNDEVIDTHTPDTFTTVSEVRIVSGQAVVALSNGELYPASAVTGLR